MNEQNEIQGDLRDEYLEIQEAEYIEANEGAPVVELNEADLEAWYADWIKRNPEACPRSEQSWIRCPDCQGEHLGDYDPRADFGPDPRD